MSPADSFNLYGFYGELKRERIIFCYSGPISQSTIEGIGQTLRLDLEMEDAGFTVSQAIFSIFIEQMQNILNYSAEKVRDDTELDKELRIGVLIIGQANDRFYIYCGNRVQNTDVPRISEKIMQIRNLSKDELKSLYKERRRQAPDAGSKGAGLGLIEMARRAGEPIDYEFIPVDDEYSFFSIKVIIGRGKDE